MTEHNLDHRPPRLTGGAPARDRLAGFALTATIALACLGLRPAHATAQPADSANEPDAAMSEEAAASAQLAALPAHRRPTLRVGTLDGRVQLLARELELSPAQQGQVKKVLLAQRQQVAALWNDSSVPAALRISRTQAIGDRTADQIRALLNDSQREKYIKPRVRETAVGSAGANVESWTPQGKLK